MNENGLISKKCFVCNQDYKVLIFMSKDNKNLKIWLPKIVEKEENFNCQNSEFYKKISNLLNLYEENCEFICKNKRDIKIFEKENYKLIPMIKVKERSYYGKYIEFNKELYDSIYSICEEYEYVPIMASIEEILNYINHILNINDNLIKPLNKLKRTLEKKE